MTPGPPKKFDADEALLRARDVFWRSGFDGTGIRELEAALGIGRKSLYDTFGSKRELFLRSIEAYADTVIGRICGRLESAEGAPLRNLERALDRLGAYHASEESLGCLLGVSMGQAGRGDEELAALLRGALKRLETALERTVRRAQEDGAIDPSARPRDVARSLVALTQGMALIGRVDSSRAMTRSIVRAALHGLRV